MMELELMGMKQCHQALYFCKHWIVITEGIMWLRLFWVAIDLCNYAALSQ